MKNIYIVLSQTGTLFSRAIRLFTRDKYNHSSLSFDPDLAVMYSFGRRGRYNMLNAGFVLENFSRGLFTFFPNTRCCVIEVPVTDAEFEAMQDALKKFTSNERHYRYNLLGVLAYGARIGLRRERHFFCSQFVSLILKNTSFWDQDPQFTRPVDFLSIPNKRIVYEGGIKDFIRMYGKARN